MSHFITLVIGENPEEQLKPFEESLNVEWVDKTEEYKKDYETKVVKEFYCASSSSWGFELNKKIVQKLQSLKIGSQIEIEINERMHYLTPGKNYNGYYRTKDNKRSKKDVWFKMIKIIRNDGNNQDVLFRGKGLIQKIAKPKKMLLKEKYPDYSTYLKEWHGIEDPNKQGYWYNPNAKWDWYSLGGRWSGQIKLKENATGKQGEPGVFNNKIGIDSARIKDIANIEELHTFAILKDGKWYEKGEMGWWGIVKDPKNEKEWEQETKTMLKNLPPDTLISFYDCHI